MQKLLALMLGLFLFVSFAVTAVAADKEEKGKLPPKHPIAKRGTVDSGKISKARKEYVQKREESKARRDRLMKEREKNSAAN